MKMRSLLIWAPILLVAAVIFVTKAFSTDLGLDTPVPENRPPVAAEFTFCEQPNPQGQRMVWYVVVSYANGDTLMFNALHLHGAPDATDAMEYIQSAKTVTGRALPCPPQL